MELKIVKMTTELQELFNEYKSYTCDEYLISNINSIDDYIVGKLGAYSYNCTLLHACILKGLIGLAERCIELGADVNKRDSTGNPALYIALFYKNHQTAELLLSSGADPNIRIDDLTYKPMTFINIPLICATDVLNNSKSIKLLLRYGAMTNEMSSFLFFIRDEKDLIRTLIAKRRWVTIKCVTLILGIHKRATITANHPDRLKQQGLFELEI